MQPHYLLNLIVSGLAAIALLGIGARMSLAHHARRRCSGNHWTVWLWSGWWVSLLLTYLSLGKLSPSWSLALVDVGNICTLAAALAYCMGDDFELPSLVPLFWILGLVFVWDLVVPNAWSSPQNMILAIGPSVLLSSLSVVCLGWAIVVRCGWSAWPMLLLAAGYAVVQLPAYISAYIVDQYSVLKPYFGTIDLFFTLLGFAKILLAGGFLGYYFSPDHGNHRPTAQYWPREVGIRPHPAVARTLLWMSSVMVSTLVIIILNEHKPEILNSIGVMLRRGAATSSPDSIRTSPSSLRMARPDSVRHSAPAPADQPSKRR